MFFDMDQSLNNIPDMLRELNEIGIALSSEKDHNRLLELILVKAMDITNCLIQMLVKKFLLITFLINLCNLQQI